MAKENEFQADNYINGDHNEKLNFITYVYASFLLPNDRISDREVCEKRSSKQGDI